MSRAVDSVTVTGTNSAMLHSDKAVVSRLTVTTGMSVPCFDGFHGAFKQVVTTTVPQNMVGAVSLTFKIDPSMFPGILSTSHCHIRN